jgi:hypothetical protein
MIEGDDWKGKHDGLSDLVFECLTQQYAREAYVRDGIGGFLALSRRIVEEAEKRGWRDKPIEEVNAEMTAYFFRELNLEYYGRP